MEQTGLDALRRRYSLSDSRHGMSNSIPDGDELVDELNSLFSVEDGRFMIPSCIMRVYDDQQPSNTVFFYCRCCPFYVSSRQ